MTDVVYRIVEHDGGWAYKMGKSYSETFPSRDDAERAAARAAQEQQMPGDDEGISWEDEGGVWHDEHARGSDRPHAYVADAESPEIDGETHEHATFRRDPKRSLGVRAFGAYDRGDQYARHGAALTRQRIRMQPLTMIVIAAIGGFVLGMLLPKSARQ